jgi:hypothetical protein
MVNPANDAVDVPSLTDITMLPEVPTLAAAGVPESIPVVLLNVAQLGRFEIENDSVPPLGSVVEGWNE